MVLDWTAEISYWSSVTYLLRNVYINGLDQDFNNSSAVAMELLETCTKPPIGDLVPWYLRGFYPNRNLIIAMIRS